MIRVDLSEKDGGHTLVVGKRGNLFSSLVLEELVDFELTSTHFD